MTKMTTATRPMASSSPQSAIVPLRQHLNNRLRKKVLIMFRRAIRRYKRRKEIKRRIRKRIRKRIRRRKTKARVNWMMWSEIRRRRKKFLGMPRRRHCSYLMTSESLSNVKFG